MTPEQHPDWRGPICAAEEHELVCHCGNSEGHGSCGDHSFTSMGCGRCLRSNAELVEQRKATP